MKRRDPIALATLTASAVMAAAAALTGLLVPELAGLGEPAVAWTRALLGGAVAFAAFVFFWTRRRLAPLRAPGADPEAVRRAANDYPFRLARLSFLCALLAGAGTGLFFGLQPETDQSRALAAAVITYLVLVLPILGAYLGTRRVLRAVASGAPGVGAVRGLRQSIGLRMAFAVQIPVVVCMTGIVFVEQHNGYTYDQRIRGQHQRQFGLVRERVARAMSDPASAAQVLERSAITAAALDATAIRTSRPSSEWLLPFALLLAVTLFAAFLGRWLTRELTGEMVTVRRALERLRTGTAAPPDPARSPSLRETAQVLFAFETALAGFQARRAALHDAARARRKAEQAKARFLAHLSHELKSPLNSILGFSEVLLTELDGPLTATQRERLHIVWRSGEMLLRFILALLDLARLDARPLREGMGPRDLGFAAHAATGAELLRGVNQQTRPDPLDRIRVELVDDTEGSDAADVVIDLARTGRAIALTAGMLLDTVETGRVEVRLAPGERGPELTVRMLESEGDDGDRERLSSLIARMTANDEADPAPVGTVTTTIRLARRVLRAQGGDMEISNGDWPLFRLRLPVVDALAQSR